MEAGADVSARQSLLRRVHETFFTDAADARAESGSLRSVIAASWRRSRRAGVEPEAASGCAPHALAGDELGERRRASGLEGAVPILRELLALA